MELIIAVNEKYYSGLHRAGTVRIKITAYLLPEIL